MTAPAPSPELDESQEGQAVENAMKLTAAEEKRLKHVAKYQPRCERHPTLCRCVVWACLVLAAIHGFNSVGSGITAYSLATGEERNFKNGFIHDSGSTSDRELVDEVLAAHILLTEFWQAVSFAGVKAMATVFFVLLFFYVRSVLRDQALLAKLHRRLCELEGVPSS